MNALAHAIEALYTPLANPVADMAALRAARRLLGAERTATSRSARSLRATPAAWPGSPCTTPSARRSCASPAPPRPDERRHAAALRAPDGGPGARSDRPALRSARRAESAADRIAELAARAGVTRLSDLGVDEPALDEIAAASLQHPAVGNTPDPPGEAELREVLKPGALTLDPPTPSAVLFWRGVKYLIVRFSAKLLITAAALVGVVGVDAASAAFPGENGKIAYVQPANGELTGYIYSYPGFGQPAGPGDYNADPAWSPDGQTVAFARDLAFGDQSFDIFVPGCCGDEDFGLAQGREPAWSPDGQKIAYASPFPPTEIHSMNVDGSANVNLTQSPGNDDQPNWSPDGQKIAFTSFRDGVPRIYVMNADGTAQAPLSGAGFGDRDPNWSPDGQRIAFAREMSGDTEIAVMNADGSGVTVLTDNNVDDREPAWSPDGTKIAYQFGDFGTSIWSMNTDGTGQTSLISGTDPDWQPVLRGYARPKGARPFHAALAIAYRECMSPNREHGAPLVTPSCSPPQQASDHLTAGTLDANGQAAKFTG